MTFGTFCSGIGSPELAWSRLGWKPRFFSEIEPFPCAVLKHHWPDVPNFGDMTKITDEQIKSAGHVDVVCAGTPCQSFSVAGLRKGMADPRGNLALAFLGLLDRIRPRWMVWENVPGVLSSWSDVSTHTPGEASAELRTAEGLDGGDFEEVEQSNDFDTFLSGLRELGYGIAWRILDAQYFGVSKLSGMSRRKRESQKSTRFGLKYGRPPNWQEDSFDAPHPIQRAPRRHNPDYPHRVFRADGQWEEIMTEAPNHNPGSQEARRAGCTCPVIDNGHGRGSGRVDKNGDPLFWISEICPIHGSDAGQAALKKNLPEVIP